MTYVHDRFDRQGRTRLQDGALIQDAEERLALESEKLLSEGYVLKRLQRIYYDPATNETVTIELEAIT